MRAAAGDLDDSGRDVVVTGPGPGASFAAKVRTFAVTSGVPSARPPSFFAYASRHGVTVAVRDAGDSWILTGPGPGLPSVVKAWTRPFGSSSLAAEAFAAARYGANVAGLPAGDALLAAPGPDPASEALLRGLELRGGLPPAGIDVAPYAGLGERFGASGAGGSFR